MKIAIDARFYGLEHAGLGRYTMNLIAELLKLDRDNKYYILLRKKYFKTLKLDSHWEKVLVDVPHYTLREQVVIPLKLKKIKPDIYHSLQINFPMMYKGKSVVTIHDLTQLSYTKRATTLPMPLYLLKHLAVKIILSQAVKKCKSIIVPSRAVGRDLIDIHNVDQKKLKVIYEGVSINNKFQDMNLPDEYRFKDDYFLYIGNAYPHKNLKRLVEAVVELNQKSKHRILLVIGGSRDVFKKNLDRFINNHNYEQYIRTVGYIPDEYMKKVYENAIGFVFPSLSEGFGLPGIEAMKAKTLLLASNTPVFKEVYKDNAIYFNPYDFTEIANKLNEVLKMSKNKRKNIIKKARIFSEIYSWEKMARHTLEVYKSV